jgi:hypothetical protein
MPRRRRPVRRQRTPRWRAPDQQRVSDLSTMPNDVVGWELSDAGSSASGPGVGSDAPRALAARLRNDSLTPTAPTNCRTVEPSVRPRVSTPVPKFRIAVVRSTLMAVEEGDDGVPSFAGIRLGLA